MRTAPGRSARTWLGAAALTLVLLAPACAQRAGPTGYPDRDVITAEEMLNVQDRTLRQVIQQLRPQWLNLRRGPTLVNAEPAPIVIYLNSSRMGGDTLDRMTAADVELLQYVNSVDAMQRYGTGHGSGAILITAR